METLNLTQGSAEWHKHRATHFNASDAPAMMGVSPYKSRNKLIQEMATGIIDEVDSATQRRFDDGHRFEALARPLAEKIIGEALFPVVGVLGKHSASFDGLTMGEDIASEHKSLNDEIRACKEAADLPLMYRVQMEQQLMVSEAEKCLFMATKWDRDDVLLEEVHFWYYPDLELRAEIVAGWAQLAEEVASYVPKEVAELPQAEVSIQLPALFINAQGGITSSNMEEYGLALAEKLKEVRSIALVTDQDFSNAKDAAKIFREQIAKLKLSKEQMLSQTMTVGEAARMIDAWSEDLRLTALQLEKDVEREDKAKKLAMTNASSIEFTEHVEALEKDTSPIRMNIPAPDWAGAIKGKSKYTSMQSGLDDLMASSKMAADKKAKDIRTKLAWYKETASDYTFLFADLDKIITKDDEDFRLQVTSRISKHKQDEEKRIADDRARIRKEEADKMAVSQIEGIRQQLIIAQSGRLGVRVGGTIECLRDTLAETEAWMITEENFGTMLAEAQTAKDSTVAQIRALLVKTEQAAESAKQAIATAQAAPIVPVVQAAQSAPIVAPAPVKSSSAPTMKLGTIAELLGFALPAEFLKSLGFEGQRVKGACLFYESDYLLICDALQRHVEAAKQKAAA